MNSSDHDEEDDDWISIAPEPRSIEAELNREGMTWKKALGEPLDNSLDAGALRVTIKMDKSDKSVVVTDNGVGCPEPAMMLKSGYSTKRHLKNMIGRYGVGLKHASYFLCGKLGTTRIITRTDKDTFQRVRVVWNVLIETNTWKIKPPQVLSEGDVARSLPERCGTSVAFQGVRARFPDKQALDALLNEFSFVFAPALRSGRQIEFTIGSKKVVLAPARDPIWSEYVEFDLAFGNRSAHVKAGIKADGDKSGRRGMSFGYGHRVIVTDESSGMGLYSKEGFAGFVDLNEHWALGQNKSSITDEYWEPLCDAILERIEPLLLKLKNSTLNLQTEAVRLGASALTNIGENPIKRPSGWHRKGDGTRKTNRRKTGRAGGLNIDFYYGEQCSPPDDSAGRVEEHSRRVELNRSLLAIDEAILTGNQQVIALLAMALWSEDCHRQKAEIPGIGESYGQLLGAYLAKPMHISSTVSRVSPTGT